MSDFGAVSGFEDVWRPVAWPKRVADAGVLKGQPPHRESHARLSRLTARAPEVMVKITGRTRNAAHLQAHLAYISRDGTLPLEGRDGERLVGMTEVAELGADWAAEDIRHRRDASLSLSVVLSMPPGTSLVGVRDAARAFAAETFGERFDYAFALHTDADHPHVHIAVRMLGQDGERLNPRKADLEQWRQTFARTLRDRDIPAEATLRRARGIIRKPEPMPVRKLRERHERGHGPAPRVLVSAREEAGRIARGEVKTERPWEAAILDRQREIRRAYLAYADRLDASSHEPSRELARRVRSFVDEMPVPITRRNEWVRAASTEGHLRQRGAEERVPDGPTGAPNRSR
jgi:type IV secretory pathway VirD2 relaxase